MKVLKIKILRMYNARNNFPYQARVICEGEKPFDKTTDEVLDWPHDKDAGKNIITLKVPTYSEYMLEIRILRIKLITYAAILGTRIKFVDERSK